MTSISKAATPSHKQPTNFQQLAIEAFKQIVSADKVNESHLQLAAAQEIRAELTMNR